MDRIRSGIVLSVVLATTLTAASVLAVSALSMAATSARADEWCGYATHTDAVIECGYTTAADCENAVGKGGMCFVDPDLALNEKRARRSLSSRIPVRS
jgi:hypothetical protein